MCLENLLRQEGKFYQLFLTAALGPCSFAKLTTLYFLLPIFESDSSPFQIITMAAWHNPNQVRFS